MRNTTDIKWRSRQDKVLTTVISSHLILEYSRAYSILVIQDTV